MKVTLEFTFSKTTSEASEVESKLKYIIDSCSSMTSGFINFLVRLTGASTWELTNLKVED